MRPFVMRPRHDRVPRRHWPASESSKRGHHMGGRPLAICARHATSDAWTPTHGHWRLDPDAWTLAPGPWRLDPGAWTLAPGPWRLTADTRAKGVGAMGLTRARPV